MKRQLLILITILFSLSSSAEDSLSIPINVKKHMQSMVGTWSFKGKNEGGKFSGMETIRVVNLGTALLQEGYFYHGEGKKEHYVILSGWDEAKKSVQVQGFTSDGISFKGEWNKLEYRTWIGKASENSAKFIVKDNSMKYTEFSGTKQKWVSEFTRIEEDE